MRRPALIRQPELSTVARSRAHSRISHAASREAWGPAQLGGSDLTTAAPAAPAGPHESSDRRLRRTADDEAQRFAVRNPGVVNIQPTIVRNPQVDVHHDYWGQRPARIPPAVRGTLTTNRLRADATFAGDSGSVTGTPRTSMRPPRARRTQRRACQERTRPSDARDAGPSRWWRRPARGCCCGCRVTRVSRRSATRARLRDRPSDTSRARPR